MEISVQTYPTVRVCLNLPNVTLYNQLIYANANFRLRRTYINKKIHFLMHTVMWQPIDDARAGLRPRGTHFVKTKCPWVAFVEGLGVGVS